MPDRVEDGRQLMNGTDAQDISGHRFGIWQSMWEIAVELSSPRLPRHYFDGDGRLHVTLPDRFMPQRTGEEAV